MSEEVQGVILYHKPVLVKEVLTYLNLQPGGVYIDATFGSGGHTRAILEAEPTCSVIAIDWDNSSLDTYGLPLQEEFGDRLRLVWGSFSHLYKIVKKERIKKLNGILADFGTSQIQIMEQPGFSIYRDTPLDMRMSRSHYHITAQEVINTGSPEKLREIFWQLGEERYAKQIVELLLVERKKKAITTTTQLAALVVKAVPKQSSHSIHPATRVFQALRMYVNKELDNIEAFLAGSVGALSPQGRLVCISFHSLEDRVVKSFFHDESQAGRLDVLTKKVVVAQDEELAVNASARSARLRVASRTDIL
ncbi:MAG: 16S rRNA (cytosine(1402)-N(4))-methyltransferase RsmH [Candidatus Dependentiae bacterium]|nr:16S rRNA (cytosine(1402)-N(4))-methyltransferase RsmH [Candidatus Dependentiae bacterium]